MGFDYRMEGRNLVILESGIYGVFEGVIRQERYLQFENNSLGNRLKMVSNIIIDIITYSIFLD